MERTKEQYIWGFLRLGMGWIFFWSFLDKLFGLGFSTSPESAWIAGGSPTSGFLQFGTHGPLSSFYQSLAGNAALDWIFMLGLLLVGLALLLGTGVRVAGYIGALMLFLMWTALLPPEHNPFLDDHIMYILVLLGLTVVKSGRWLGLGEWWSKTSLVKKYPILE